MTNGRCSHALALAALAGLATCGPKVEGAILTWSNPFGGSAALASNWNPAQVPTSVDTLNWDGGTIGVSFNASVPASRAMNFRAGTYTLNFIAPHTTASMVVGGTVNSLAQVQVTAGELTAGSVRVGVGASATTRTLTVSGVSSITTLGTGDLTVGSDAGGSVVIGEGSDFSSADDVLIGTTAGIAGSVVVRDTVRLPEGGLSFSTISCGGDVLVGTLGTGDLALQSGGRCVCAGNMEVGSLPTGVGDVDMTSGGSGSFITVAGGLSVGGNTIVGGAGSGSLTIGNRALVDVTGAMSLGDAEGQSLARLTMLGGTLRAASMACFDGCEIVATGVIDAPLVAQGIGASSLTLTGPLEVGRDGVSQGFTWTRTLNVGAFPLLIRSAGVSRLGDVALQGGSIASTGAAGVSFATGDSLIGTGTIESNAAFSAGATVSATGTTGLIFRGAVSPLGTSGAVSMSGTRVRFDAGSSFTGRGSINASVSCAGNLTLTGPLTLGNGTVSGFDDSGTTPPHTYNIGPHSLTLSDTTGVPLSQVVLAGGQLVGLANLQARSGALSGFGSVVVPEFMNHSAGRVAPGANGSTGVGLLTFSGTFLSGGPFTPGAIDIDLGGSLPSQYDRIAIAGSATRGGTLNVSLINGFQPQPGSVFTIMTAASMSGQFATVNLAKPTIGGLSIEYTPTSVRIVYCAADFNGDGGVDGDDVIAFFEAWDAADGAADFNGDGGVDGDDAIGFFGSWDGGC